VTCTGCGANLPAGAQFCPVCGTDVPRSGAGSRPSRAADASVVLGFLGLTLVPLVCSLLAIRYALRARRQIATDPNLSGGTAAMVGLALGITGTLVVLLLVLLLVVDHVAG
jgi:Domain of unknown function (DUF4190)/zinc-ribbon domain